MNLEGKQSSFKKMNSNTQQNNFKNIQSIQLIGFLGNSEYLKYKKFISKLVNTQMINVKLEVVEFQYEAEYDIRVKKIKKDNLSFLKQFLRYKLENNVKKPPFFIIDKNSLLLDIQDFEMIIQSQIVQEVENSIDNVNYLRQSEEYMDSLYKESSNFLNITMSYEDIEIKLVIELFRKVTPKSCRHFELLIDKQIGFNISQFYRFGFIQGQIFSKYTDEIEQENFLVNHDSIGILGLWNTGAKNQNQFYITLGKMSSFDSKQVAIGRIVSGLKSFEKLNKITPTEITMPNISLMKKYQNEKVENYGYNNAYRTTISRVRPGDQSIRSQKKTQSSVIYALPSRQDIFNANFPSYKNFETMNDFILNYLSEEVSIQEILYAIIDIFNYIYSRLQQNIYFTEDQFQVFQEELVEFSLIKLEETEVVSLVLFTKNEQIEILPGQGRFMVVLNIIDVQHPMDLQNCGSLFSIYKKISTQYKRVNQADILLSGDNIVLSGYAVYGQTLAITLGYLKKLSIFVKDQENGIFVTQFKNKKFPKRSGIVSCNEGNFQYFDNHVKKFIKRKKQQGYYCRFTGSLCADFHRNLLYGGIFMQPPMEEVSMSDLEFDNDNGTNIFDAQCMANIIDKAWERHSSGVDGCFIKFKPFAIDQRLSVYYGFSAELLDLENMYLSIRRKNSIFGGTGTLTSSKHLISDSDSRVE